VKVRLFGCKKFGRLLNEREDRSLSQKEQGFLEKHRSVCYACKKEDSASVLSLNMLREAAIDQTPAASFDERLLRRIRINRVRESLGYWTPALIGGSIACAALFVTLHMLSAPATPNSATIPNGEARRTTNQPFPNLELTHLPSVVR
jgi:hypothetical protein